MTFSFDTYPADILNTPSIITGSNTKFTDEDAKFFAANLTSCAFLNEKYDVSSPNIELAGNDDPHYKTQVYRITPTDSSSPYKALVGFTWDNGKKEMFFGIFEFEKPAAGEESKKIATIKIYKVLSNDISEIKFGEVTTEEVNQQTQILTCNTGVFSKNGHDPLFGYKYDGTTATKVNSFYLPPKSFFLDGKHAPVTSPSLLGTLSVIASDIYSFKNTE